MVAVPTWFWVEGYDGDVIPLTDNLLLTHDECRRIQMPRPDAASRCAACPAGLGQPFTDPHSASPIAHTYRWSSLGINGDADAYTIGLQITFGAQYRFSTNGGSPSGWQTLGDRALAWTAQHQVQEAQAVLTRP